MTRTLPALILLLAACAAAAQPFPFRNPDLPLEERLDDLLGPQQRLLERIVALVKPTVLVLLNGGALAIPWADAHVPAIVEAWYPGQAAGTALADILFGDASPGGRLPVTFYRRTEDLPPFEDYTMKGRTYRFFEGTPLYPFGHGLSYTTFAYAGLRTDRNTLSDGDTLTLLLDVTNTGERTGDEVVQLYVQYPASSVPRPRLELKGFDRLTLAPGETRTVVLRLPASELRYWDEAAAQWVLEPGPVRLLAGVSSADLRLETTIDVRPR
ncbi:MAG: hypothetical protein KatS3mg043_0188 [Rhodothermaceae bacterium]|nr:MAG: hypothetical protein KatS3mg043_0188 [Rhodothermaceae bacterium]